MSMAAGGVFGSEFKRYADPATELEVIRLTNPAFASGLTAPHLRQFTKRADALIYWSERDGTRQIYRLDLKSGESKQLTSAAALDVGSFAFSSDDKYLYYFDGPVLQSITSSSPKPRDVYRVPDGATRTGLTVASDGTVLFAEDSRIMRVALQKTGPVLEVDRKVDLLMARPRHAQFVYGQGGVFWIVNTDGTGKKQLALASGDTGESLWSPTGRSLLYLHIPDDPKQLITLRENSPDDQTDQLISRTSQFGAFAPNGGRIGIRRRQPQQGFFLHPHIAESDQARINAMRTSRVGSVSGFDSFRARQPKHHLHQRPPWQAGALPRTGREIRGRNQRPVISISL